MPLTKEQQKAIRKIPVCVDLDQVDEYAPESEYYRVQL